MNWALAYSSGATTTTPGISSSIASASSSLSRGAAPLPSRTLLISALPGLMLMRFAPRLRIWAAMRSRAPLPTATITTRAATPIMMPKRGERAAQPVSPQRSQGELHASGSIAEHGRRDPSREQQSCFRQDWRSATTRPSRKVTMRSA